MHFLKEIPLQDIQKLRKEEERAEIGKKNNKPPRNNNTGHFMHCNYTPVISQCEVMDNRFPNNSFLVVSRRSFNKLVKGCLMCVPIRGWYLAYLNKHNTSSN